MPGIGASGQAKFAVQAQEQEKSADGAWPWWKTLSHALSIFSFCFVTNSSQAASILSCCSRFQSLNFCSGGSLASIAWPIPSKGCVFSCMNVPQVPPHVSIRSGPAESHTSDAVVSSVRWKTPTSADMTSTSVKDHLPKTASQ